MNEKRDTESTEIIWKLTYKHDNLLLELWIVILWSLRVCVLSVFIWISYIMVKKLYQSFDKEILDIVVFGAISILFIVVALGYGISIIRTLNTKRIYATSTNLVIERFIGKNITFEMGSFYFCDFSHAFTAIYADSTTISKFGEEVYNTYSFLDPLRSNNIQELYAMIKPQTQECLSKIDLGIYESFKSRHSKISPRFDLDFEKIDELREEKNND